MAMILDYAPGASLADPYAFTQASRGISTYRVAADGTLRSVAPTTTIDNHYINGLRTTLLEIGSVNRALQSQALATSPWSVTNVFSITNNAATAPDGTATATNAIPNNSNTNQHFVIQNGITITATENLAASFFVKANGYTGIVMTVDDGTNGFRVWANLTNGTSGGFTVGTGTVTGTFIVPLANGWFWVGGWGSTGSSGTTTGRTYFYLFDTGAHAQTLTAYAGNQTDGLLIWGAQVERWGTAIKGPPTSYMPTTVAAATRATAPLSMPWLWQTMPMWGYVKFFDLGWSARAVGNAEPLLMFTDALVGNPSLKLLAGAGTPGLNPSHRINYISRDGAGNQSFGNITGAANYQDTVELFWQIFEDASVSIQRSINGGAVSSASDSGASPDFFDFASRNGGTPTLYLADGAQVALLRIKIGFGTAPITTLAQAAAA